MGATTLDRTGKGREAARWLFGLLLDKLTSDDKRRASYFSKLEDAVRDSQWSHFPNHAAFEIHTWGDGKETRREITASVQTLVEFARLALPYFREASMKGQLPALAALYDKFGKT